MKTLFLYFILVSVSGRIKTLVDVTKAPATVDIEKTTVNPKAISLGSCPCDLSNSCDVYCCCDPDCGDDIIDFWKTDYANYCAKSYIYEKYKPSQQCIDDQILYNMNLRMGMSKTQLNQKTCVTMDVGGAFQTYVDEKKADDAQVVMAELQPNLTYPLLKQQSFNAERQSQLFSDGKYQALLKEGDQMSVTTGTSRFNKQITPFTMPQPIGFNGICMSSIGVQFLNDVPSESCHQYISDLTFAANTFLNPNMYGGPNFMGQAGKAQILNGIGDTFSNYLDVDIGDVWILSTADNKLTKQPVNTVTDTTNSGCSVTNAVKEAFYTVTYSNLAERTNIGFQITSVKVDLVLQDTLAIDAVYCPSTPTTGADLISTQGYNYEMKFGIQFIPKLAQQINGAVFKKSGNPGYKTQYPIIVGENSDFTSVQKVNQNGFKVQHHDATGKCFKANALPDDEIIDHSQQVINFEELTYLTCSVELTLADLKAYCEGTHTDKFEEYEMFKQIYDRFQWVSVFGNSNIQYKKDWTKVIFPTGQETKPTVGTWDDATQTCKNVVAGFNIRFLTSRLGFVNSLQKYIVAVEVAEIQKDWQFTAATGQTQSFMHIVSMQYHEILHKEYISATSPPASFFLPKMPSDLFYPFQLEY